MDHHRRAAIRRLARTHTHVTPRWNPAGGEDAHVNIVSLHVRRGGTSRRVRGCLSFLIASPPLCHSN